MWKFLLLILWFGIAFGRPNDDPEVKDECDYYMFTCGDKRCVLNSWVCDSEKDCTDGSDEGEELCKNRVCSESEFRCASGKCIHLTRVCDHENDCQDGGDEVNCKYQTDEASSSESPKS